MRINAAWHARHPMPHDARFEQRVAWHVAHQRHCGCQPMPAAIYAALIAGALGDDSLIAPVRRVPGR
jgi:hypothetical protein